MLYCDYDTYSAMGGTMSAEQYGFGGRVHPEKSTS